MQAIKQFKKSFKKALKKEEGEALEFCLKEFLGNVYNINGFATTSYEFKDIMTREQLDPTIKDLAINTLETLESVKYGAGKLDEKNIKICLSNINMIMLALKKRYKL